MSRRSNHPNRAVRYMVNLKQEMEEMERMEKNQKRSKPRANMPKDEVFLKPPLDEPILVTVQISVTVGHEEVMHFGLSSKPSEMMEQIILSMIDRFHNK